MRANGALLNVCDIFCAGRIPAMSTRPSDVTAERAREIKQKRVAAFSRAESIEWCWCSSNVVHVFADVIKRHRRRISGITTNPSRNKYQCQKGALTNLIASRTHSSETIQKRRIVKIPRAQTRAQREIPLFFLKKLCLKSTPEAAARERDGDTTG